jgi:hypothetical protein
MKNPYKSFAICAVLLGCSTGNCQYSTGTAIAVIDAHKFAVIAADSMVLYNGTTITDNDACKIRLAKPSSIVVIGGIGNKGEVDFASIGAGMLARANVTDLEGLKKATAEWTNYMVEWFTQEIKTHEQVMLDFAERKVTTVAIFLTVDKHRQIIGDEGGIQIAKDNTGKAIVSPLTLNYPLRRRGENVVTLVEWASAEHTELQRRASAGDQSAAKLGISLHFGKAESEIEAAANQFIEGAKTDFKDKVGGPIDEILLDANGPQWIHVKTKCDVDVMTGK